MLQTYVPKLDYCLSCERYDERDQLHDVLWESPHSRWCHRIMQCRYCCAHVTLMRQIRMKGKTELLNELESL
jgi:hypothetical protein